MGCNCSGGKKGATIAQARSSGRSVMPAGFSADKPLAIQLDNAPLTSGPVTETPIRVRVIKPVAGLKLGQAAWVTGSGVRQHVDSGALVDITRTAQKQRQWRIGAFVYSDFAKASRVAAAQGTLPVEIA